MTDHGYNPREFVPEVRELVALNDRVPSRGPDLKPGDRVMVVRGGRVHLLDVEDVQPCGNRYTLTVTTVGGE